MCGTFVFSRLMFSPCPVNSPSTPAVSPVCHSPPRPGRLHRSFFMASFITVFRLMRSSTATNSSGLSTLHCLSPIFTSNSPDAPSATTTLVFSYMPSAIVTSASSNPIPRSFTIAISLGTVSKAVSSTTSLARALAAPPCVPWRRASSNTRTTTVCSTGRQLRPRRVSLWWRSAREHPPRWKCRRPSRRACTCISGSDYPCRRKWRLMILTSHTAAPNASGLFRRHTDWRCTELAGTARDSAPPPDGASSLTKPSS